MSREANYELESDVASQAGNPPSGTIPETAKVNQAVRYINERVVLSGLQLAKEVGEYILNTFFDGDYGAFANPSRRKPTSFRALVDREDLMLGRSTLHAYVSISYQLKCLPSEVVDRLSLTHHRALLSLPDDESRVRLARLALAEGWSSRTLTMKVRELCPMERTARIPRPKIAVGIDRVVKGLQLAYGQELSDDLRRISKEEAGRLAAQVEQTLERLAELRAILTRQASAATTSALRLDRVSKTRSG